MAESARVDGNIDQRLGGQWSVAIVGYQFGHTGQVLGDASSVGVLSGVSQSRVAFGCGVQRLQIGAAEPVRHGDVGTGQQFTCLGKRV
jgi:hypothetical protein